jgi:hypothetical protein
LDVVHIRSILERTKNLSALAIQKINEMAKDISNSRSFHHHYDPDDNQRIETYNDYNEELFEQHDQQSVTGETESLQPIGIGLSGIDVNNLFNSLSDEQKTAAKPILDYLDALDQYENNVQEWSQHQRNVGVLPHRSSMPLEQPTAPNPPRIFVTGPGRTGKSYLIHTISSMVRDWCLQKASQRRCPSGGVLLLAPTGVAAFNINGTTIHHALRIHPEKQGVSSFSPLPRMSQANIQDQLQNLVLVIIDEVSMVSSKLFSTVSTRLNQIFEIPDGFFGQRAVLLVGDFLQLPPVCGHYIFQDDKDVSVPPHFHLFKSIFYPIFLTIPQRQREDQSFANMLERIRNGSPSFLDIGNLVGRSLTDDNHQRELLEEALENEE